MSYPGSRQTPRRTTHSHQRRRQYRAVAPYPPPEDENPDVEPLLAHAAAAATTTNDDDAAAADVRFYESLRPAPFFAFGQQAAAQHHPHRRAQQRQHPQHHQHRKSAEVVPLLGSESGSESSSRRGTAVHHHRAPARLPHRVAAARGMPPPPPPPQQHYVQSTHPSHRIASVPSSTATTTVRPSHEGRPWYWHPCFCGPLWYHGCCCAQCVRTSEVGVLQTFGQFRRMLRPGFHFLLWPCQRIPHRLSLRLQQLHVTCETKTKDNVFVHVEVAVQYRVRPDRAYDAYYRLSHPPTQIRSHVYDVVRSTLPRMNVDDAFASKSDVALECHRSLSGMMDASGFELVNALVLNVMPDAVVVASMNEMNASKRMKDAMPYRAEAEKLQKVKAAEAEAERLYLLGVGVARERKEIARGMRDCVSEFAAANAEESGGGQRERRGNEGDGSVDAVSPKDVMDLLVLTQYFDLLSAVGAGRGGGSAVFQHLPGEVSCLQQQLSPYFLGSTNAAPSSETSRQGSVSDLLW